MLSLLLLACGTGPEPAEPTGTEPTLDVESLRERGPWAAGSRSYEIVGSSGVPLPLQLWFPADGQEQDVLYDGLVPGSAAFGAPVACDEVRGLVAFSHGNGGTRVQSPFLTEHLASHGYVVVSPDHTGNTLLDLSVPLTEMMLRRPVDIADAVDAALDDDELGRCLPDDGYVVIGHSFGGYTALATGGATVNDFAGGEVDLSDPRVTGVVGLAPWDAAGGITDGGAAIDVPTLLLTGERDATTPIAQVQRLYDPMVVEPRWLGVFPDGGHYTFSPVACLLFQGDGCGEDFLAPEVADPLTNASVTAFVAGLYEAVGIEAPELAWD